MEMPSLRILHMSMVSIGVDMQQFRFVAGAAEFECIFSSRETPFVLSLTSRGQNPEFFKFDVSKYYNINAYLGDDYTRLVRVLFVDGHSGHRLEPRQFFLELNDAVPTIAKGLAVPTETEIVRLRHDVDERECPYFDRWEQRGKGPTPRNLKKTRLMLGPRAEEFSISVNKSSIWSATPTGRTWF